jgi:hypothetical protein
MFENEARYSINVFTIYSLNLVANTTSTVHRFKQLKATFRAWLWPLRIHWSRDCNITAPSVFMEEKGKIQKTKNGFVMIGKENNLVVSFAACHAIITPRLCCAASY